MAARECPSVANIQRLGYVLEFIGFKKLASLLALSSRIKKAPSALLVNYSKARVGPRDKKWNLILNEHLEIER